MKLLRSAAAYLFILFLGISTAMAQQVPAKAAFQKKFPNAQNVNWGKEGGDEYEAEFTLNGKKMSANFDRQGNWKETETAIAMNELPDAVQQTLSRDYKDVKIKHAFKVESPDPTVYEIEVQTGENHEKMEENEEDENDEHGEENGENEEYEHEHNVHELVFTKDGKVVHHKKEEEEEEDED